MDTTNYALRWIGFAVMAGSFVAAAAAIAQGS
jgi:hypothetical protein